MMSSGKMLLAILMSSTSQVPIESPKKIADGSGRNLGQVEKLPNPPSMFDRLGSGRELLLTEGGGNADSEAAIARGLSWLAKRQLKDGCWQVDFGGQGGVGRDARGIGLWDIPSNLLVERATTVQPDRYDCATTGLVLMAFLGTGKSHRASKDEPYAKTVEKGINYLTKIQNSKTGEFRSLKTSILDRSIFRGSDLYGHGICTIAICEAYGLTKDAALKAPAQKAINFLVSCQHSGGSWGDYGNPSQRLEGDTDVTGWQVMALKAGQAAGLNVPTAAFLKASAYLDQVADKSIANSSESRGSEGYRHLPLEFTKRIRIEDRIPTPEMTAMGLLARAWIDGWTEKNNPRCALAIKNYLQPFVPTKKYDQHAMYFHFFATQAMYHTESVKWKEWNQSMRALLIDNQDVSDEKSDTFGSWPLVDISKMRDAGYSYANQNGYTTAFSDRRRLTRTALNVITLEVYYRYAPVHRETKSRVR